MKGDSGESPGGGEESYKPELGLFRDGLSGHKNNVGRYMHTFLINK